MAATATRRVVRRNPKRHAARQTDYAATFAAARAAAREVIPEDHGAEYASEVERLADYLRQGKISRESITKHYIDDVRNILLWPGEEKYRERQEGRLEAIRLSGVEPLPQTLIMMDGKYRLILDPEQYGALDKARGEWAAKGYRVEESAMPFGWTRIDVSTRAGNPGVVKQPWQMSQAEYYDYTGKGNYPFGVSDEAVERWMSIEDERKRLVGPRSGKEILGASDRYGHNFEHRWIVGAALSEGLPVPPEVLAEYPELRVGNPGYLQRFAGGVLGKGETGHGGQRAAPGRSAARAQDRGRAAGAACRGAGVVSQGRARGGG